MNNTKLFLENDYDIPEEVGKLLPSIPENGEKIKFSLNDSGSFNIRSADAVLNNIGGMININGENVSTAQFEVVSVSENRIELKLNDLRWVWNIFVREKDVLIAASLTNLGAEPIEICNLDLLKINGADIFSSYLNRLTFFNWQTWSMGVRLIENKNGSYSSSNIMHLHDPKVNKTVVVGFLTLSRMQAQHHINAKENEGITDYTARLSFGKYSLQPGKTFNSELCSVSFHADPYEALELWAEKVKIIYQPELKELPPVGWVGGSWTSATFCGGGLTAEQNIRNNAQAIRERLRGFDVSYIWISQVNLKDYIPGNWLNENTDEFPSGLKTFFAELNKIGFNPGLWVSPFWFYGEAEGMLEEHYSHLLRDKSDEPICREETWGWRYDDDDLPWYHMHRYNLDGSHPETIKYIHDLFTYYNELGVRYYMLDFLGIVENSMLYDSSKTAYQAGYSILREIRAAAGIDTHIQTAVASSPGFTGTINAARIGRDFGEGRCIDTSLNDWRNATSVLHDLHYSNTKACLQNIAGSYFTHQVIYMNDFNLLTIDKPYPLEHARIATTLFGLGGGSPLMIGDSIPDMDDERLRYLKMCLPRTNHSAKPADLFERIQPNDYSRIMKLQIDTEWDSYLLAGVCNMDTQPYDLTLDFEKLGLDKDEKYVLYEFWNEEYCGVFRDSFPCHLPSDSCKLYRISKKRTHPWLLSTDMHIQQGYCEILDLKWDESKQCLSGTVTRPAGEKGNVYILMPRNYKLINCKGTHLLKELLDYNVIVHLPIKFNNSVERFELYFEEWNFRMLSPRGHIPYATKQEWQDYMNKNYSKQKTRLFE